MTEQRFADGSEYVGDLSPNGLPEGQGRMLYSSGDVYEGGWEGGQFRGRGTFQALKSGVWSCDGWRGPPPMGFNGNGSVEYPTGTTVEGTWIGGRPHGEACVQRWGAGAGAMSGCVYRGAFDMGVMQGRGRLEWPNGDVYEGDFSGGRQTGWGSLTRAGAGERYQGCFKEGVFDGDHGTYQNDKTGISYEGEWKGGLRHGRGVCRRAGVMYNGDWARGEYEGEGTQIYPGGEVFSGTFARGLPNGQGSKIWPNGDLFNGWFHMGVMQRGKYSFGSGELYEGELDAQGKPHGQGLLWTNDGAVYVGAFVDGRRHGRAVVYVTSPAAESSVDLLVWESTFVADLQQGTSHCFNVNAGTRWEEEWNSGKLTSRGAPSAALPSQMPPPLPERPTLDPTPLSVAEEMSTTPVSGETDADAGAAKTRDEDDISGLVALMARGISLARCETTGAPSAAGTAVAANDALAPADDATVGGETQVTPASVPTACGGDGTDSFQAPSPGEGEGAVNYVTSQPEADVADDVPTDEAAATEQLPDWLSDLDPDQLREVMGVAKKLASGGGSGDSKDLEPSAAIGGGLPPPPPPPAPPAPPPAPPPPSSTPPPPSLGKRGGSISKPSSASNRGSQQAAGAGGHAADMLKIKAVFDARRKARADRGEDVVNPEVNKQLADKFDDAHMGALARAMAARREAINGGRVAARRTASGASSELSEDDGWDSS